jgi:hypothetical protein
MGRQAKAKQERQEKKNLELLLAELSLDELSSIKDAVTRAQAVHGFRDNLMDDINVTRYEVYCIGLDVGLVINDISMSFMQISNMLNNICDVYISTQGLPEKMQVTQLRSWFTQKAQRRPMDKRLVDATYTLRRAIEDGAKLLEAAIPDAIDHDVAQQVVKTALAFSDGVHALMREREPDNGEMLSAAISTYGARETIEAAIASMQERAVKWGRRSEPTPVNQYILTRTRYLEQLHKLKTRGEAVEALMKELRAHPDVQQWIEFKRAGKASEIARLIVGQCVEVQAFDVFDGLDRRAANDKLKDIRKNNPNWGG